MKNNFVRSFQDFSNKFLRYDCQYNETNVKIYEEFNKKLIEALDYAYFVVYMYLEIDFLYK